MRNKFNKRKEPLLAEAEINELATQLEQAALAKGQTREDIFNESMSLLERLRYALEEQGPSFELDLPRAFLPVEEAHITTNLNNMLSDMAVLYNFTEALGSSVVEGWNFAASGLGRVRNKVQLTASRLTDVSMFRQGSVDAFVWADTFDNASRLDLDGGLLQETICNINDADGVVTLPLETDTDPTIALEKPQFIGNGVIGYNNASANDYHGYHGDITALLDKNPDTWVEYERIDNPADTSQGPLLLTILLPLTEEKIINEVRINPTNLGTAKSSKIIEIETSLDGREWLSVKDEIAFGDFALDDEENVFRLGPTTSKYSGIGIYMFLPRKAKYVRIQLSQDEPYTITTSSGQKSRYAIGIRDIEVRANIFKDKGAIVSQPISLSSPARKIYLSTAQNPASENIFSKIEHLISWNNGGSWNSVKPTKFIGNEEIPLVLNLNGPEEGAINTGTLTPTELRYKAIFSRSADGFQEQGNFKEKRKLEVEMKTVPKETPFTLSLAHKPLGDVSAVFGGSNLGSKGNRGNPYRLFASPTGLHALPHYQLRQEEVDKAVDANASRVLQLGTRLPFAQRASIQRNYADWILNSGIDLTSYNSLINALPTPLRRAYQIPTVPGQMDNYAYAPSLWVYSPLVNSFLLEGTHYTVDHQTGTIEFHLEGVGLGDLEAAKLEFLVYFPAERLLVEDNIAYLEFPALSTSKSDLVIKSVKGINKSGFDRLVPGQSSHKLSNQNIILGTASLKGPTGWGAFVPFEGVADLTTLGPKEWTIDLMNGYLHTSPNTLAQVGDLVQYQYLDAEAYIEGEGFKNVPGKPDQIELLPDAVHPLDETIYIVPSGFDSGYEVFNLGHPSIVEGSLSFLGAAVTSGVFAKEVPYEPELYIKTATDEPLTCQDAGVVHANIARFKVNFQPWSPYWDQAIFSNTSLFTEFVDPDTPYGSMTTGQWKWSLADQRVLELCSPTPVAGHQYGTFSYPYKDPSRDLTNGGYMVDYKHGLLYTFSPFPTTASIKVTYKYLYLIAEYDIGQKLVLGKDYEVQGQSLTLKSSARQFIEQANRSEIQNIPSGGEQTYAQLQLPEGKLYLTYEYNALEPVDLKELEKYYSPILRSYCLRIVTQDRMPL